MQPNEQHRAILPVGQFEERFVFFATTKGIVKKTPLGAFSRPRPSGIIALTLDPDDELIGAELSSGKDNILLGTRNGLAIQVSEEDVRAMGRSARGVKGMTLSNDDRVVDMVVVRPGTSILTICENGFGKRTDIEEYRQTHRGGKGIINIKTTERNGRVVAIKAVQDDDELMITSANGIMLRTDLSSLREIGRATQGVRVIRVEEGDRVAAVARIAREENGDKEEHDIESQGPNGSPTEGSAPSPAQDDAPEATDTPSTDANQENEEEA
jgi:DNA gyrase subunit A